MTPEYINLFDRISVYRKDNETIKSNTYSNCIDDLILFKEFCDYFGTMENYKELGGQYPNSLDIAFMSYYKFGYGPEHVMKDMVRCGYVK